MSIKYTSFANAEALDKAIDGAFKKAQSLRADIQNVAVGILLHAHKHGDYTRAQTLVDGLGQSVRGKALVDWFVQFGGLQVGKLGGNKDGFIGWQGAEYIKAHIDEAKAKMWWECKPEAPFAGFDMKTELERLIARAEKHVKQADKLRREGLPEDADKVHVPQATLDALRKLVA